MGLASSIIIPIIEKHIHALEPEVIQLVLNELKDIGIQCIKYAEDKLSNDSIVNNEKPE